MAEADAEQHDEHRRMHLRRRSSMRRHRGGRMRWQRGGDGVFGGFAHGGANLEVMRSSDNPRFRMGANQCYLPLEGAENRGTRFPVVVMRGGSLAAQDLRHRFL